MMLELGNIKCHRVIEMTIVEQDQQQQLLFSMKYLGRGHWSLDRTCIQQFVQPTTPCSLLPITLDYFGTQGSRNVTVVLATELYGLTKR